MNIFLFAFIIIVSILFALLEIQIEGEHGWAAKLPTWRLKNPFRKFINWPYITGYHVYLNAFLFFIFQLPFFVGLAFTVKNELLIITVLLWTILLEDFFWFVLNPKWGIKKFFTKDIGWHSGKILFLPKNYWFAFLALVTLEIIKRSV